MKIQFHSHRERAVALIIVLAMLVLLSGLVVSFMTTVGNERAASIVNNNELTSRQIADSTVNMVISQIREATSQSGKDVSVPSTWASQPGAIRTLSGSVGPLKPINTGAGGVKQWTYQTGNNDFIFKLYSAEKMKIPALEISGNAWDKKEVEIIEKWDRTLPDATREETRSLFGYVDLNEPIVTPMPSLLTGGDPRIVEPRYPIIDPRAKYLINEDRNATADPGIVDGFDIKTTGSTGMFEDANLKFITKDRTGKRGGTQKVPYLPMPVKWLYVMRDGTMAAAEDANGGKIPGATEDNPIIGRTGFWTDDDTSRLNINTASEGTFWDTPTASSEQESGNVESSGVLSSPQSPRTLALGASQPVRGEYQRYPGHPATTCLSPVLGWMWNIMPKDAAKPNRDATLIAMKDGLAQIAPFSPYGKKGQLPLNPPQSTSMGGSYNPDPDADPNKDPQLAIATKRLYTTVDEMVFKQDRVTANAKDPTPLNSANITPESLEKVRFFLTANSRSPELNIFGRPRVTFWPVNAKEELRTAYDDLFAFTSTLYKDPSGDRSKDNTFYFTRYDAKSAANDYKSTAGGLTQRNVEIMNYLRTLTGTKFPIPSFGGSFAGKYGEDEKEEVLALIFDYCRAVNLVDTSTRSRAGAYQPYTPFYGQGSGYQDYTTRSNDWSGQVTPGRINVSQNPKLQYQGLGRFPTISEAALIFYRVGAFRAKDKDDPTGDGLQVELQAAMVFEMTNPMAGNPAIRDTYWTRVTVDRATLVDVDQAVPDVVDRDIRLVGSPGDSRINIVNVGNHDVGWARGYMPSLGFMHHVHYFVEPSGWTDITDPLRPKPAAGNCLPKAFSNIDDSSKVYKRGTTSKFYPYVSDKFTAPAKWAVKGGGTPKLKFKGGAYKVEIYSGEAPDDPRSQLVQTVHLDFGTKQVIVDCPKGIANADSALDKRINGRQDLYGFPTTANGDVVRSIEYVGSTGAGNGTTLPLAQQGDFRLAIARADVPAAAYTPRSPLIYYTNVPMVHGLQRGWGDPYQGYKPDSVASRGTFATGAPIRDNKPPILPEGVKGIQNADGGPGDWDRGLSKHMDGSLGGKADEGNVWFNYGDSADGGRVPYFRGRGIEETGRSFFSPNRQISSAVMFGSLPTGVVRGLPWQTLLFRPDRGARSHPGAQGENKPADHLILDLFNLPIVEPYAISEPFSSGGKVNLNYVIAPFGYAAGDAGTRTVNGNKMKMPRSYLRRDSALRGVLKSVMIMAVPTSQPLGGHSDGPTNTTTQFRFDIDAERTLDQFEDRLKDPQRGLFRSASEICDMDLYPVGPTVSDWGTFWETTYAQTGDNMRERPYSHIYPRVTTKSNIYTVYMRCQAIKKVAGTKPDKFDPKLDKVIGSYRGSATIERFIDPNDAQLANYDPNAADSSVDKYYRFRVLATKQFLPR